MEKVSKDLFVEDSDSDIEFKTENEYAKNYENWRKKEELNKLQTKYGDNFLEDSESSSSSDDEDAIELTEDVKKDFFKTLSYLKKKDPKIYDSNVNFFKSSEDGIKKEKKKKEEPMYLKDYERKLLLEQGGVIEDDINEISRPITNADEEKRLREEVIKQVANIEEGEGSLFQVRKKTVDEVEKEEAVYLKWLTGQTEEMKDDEIKTELKPLKEFWNNPNLDSEEKFLRDYILKKKYLEEDEEDYVPTYDEIIHDSDGGLSDDEKEVEKQEEFEHKYNFRFEEPDNEFIKRYPRTIEKSLRKTDDRRKLKRAETKERKKKEKEDKMADIKKLQELKRKEIEEKIEKIKQIAGTREVALEEDDIEGDFDPEAYDRRMQSLYNQDFYKQSEGNQKPEFPDIDEELEIEGNWDHYEEENIDYEPHCEDDSFNMNADFDPTTSTKPELIENTKGRKKRKRKSKVAEALKRSKPKYYDSNDKNWDKYFDEHFKLECEDVLGDIPCRFGYKKVIPNNFGLNVDEILLAKEKELNKWCSIKKTIQCRPDNVEKYDQIAYARKANDINLKRKIFPSVFSEEADEANNVQLPSTSSHQKNKNSDPNSESSTAVPETVTAYKVGDSLEASNNNMNISLEKSAISNDKQQKKKKKKKKKIKDNSKNDEKCKEGTPQEEEGSKKKKEDHQVQLNNDESTTKKNRKRKRFTSESKQGGKKIKKDKSSSALSISDARLAAFGINPKKFKNKIKYGNKNKI